MRRLVATLVLVPVAIVLIALAVANRVPVRLAFDPFNPTTSPLAVTLPLFWVVFAALAIGVLLGGAAVWLRQGRFRKAARREHDEAARWRREAERGRARANAGNAAALPAPSSRSAA